jgi:hypothetical protein
MYSAQKKLFLLGSCLIFIFSLYLLKIIYEPEKEKALLNHCIYDPIHDLVEPLNADLKNNSLYKMFLTAIDGLLIECGFFAVFISFVLTTHSISVFPSLIIFYIVRGISMSTVKWPEPKIFIFENPGIPNYFIMYDRSNDLYFSGHTGGVWILLFDSILNKHKAFVIYFFPVFFLTLYMLVVEGVHYVNDILIGFAAAYSIVRIYYHYRFSVADYFIDLYVKLFKLLNQITKKMKAKKQKNSLKNNDFISNKSDTFNIITLDKSTSDSDSLNIITE